eukprot:GHVT01033329.1.p2 GENE.GHVT01033329.1~~GHVT01033329.1.p2  ORF type:complete len:131 (+),score=7.56 GHVT01033329.1:520-912(+)
MCRLWACGACLLFSPIGGNWTHTSGPTLAKKCAPPTTARGSSRCGDGWAPSCLRTSSSTSSSGTSTNSSTSSSTISRGARDRKGDAAQMLCGFQGCAACEAEKLMLLRTLRYLRLTNRKKTKGYINITNT